MACRAGVGAHARRKRGGTLVEHAGEARRLSCEGGGLSLLPAKLNLVDEVYSAQL